MSQELRSIGWAPLQLDWFSGMDLALDLRRTLATVAMTFEERQYLRARLDAADSEADLAEVLDWDRERVHRVARSFDEDRLLGQVLRKLLGAYRPAPENEERRFARLTRKL
jgi:hypothetical protein